MEAVVNKDLIQSYILTCAKYDFSIMEKRILYYIVVKAHEYSLKYGECDEVKRNLFGVEIEMPVAWCLNGSEDKNHARVKSALQSLQKKIFTYEDDEIWESISIIAFPRIMKRNGKLYFQVHNKVWDCVLDFSHGYRRYELKTSMFLKSVFSMRFYELMSNQKRPLIFSIEQLKSMFQIENKYKRVNDFFRFVIDTAKKELDKSCPYTFEYEPLKSGKKITAIKFYPVEQPQYRDEDLEKDALKRKLSLSWSLDYSVRQYLKQSIGFSDNEIKNNLDLFKSAQTILPDLLLELSILKGKARDKKNPKGYIINSLRGKIKDIRNK